MLNLCFHNINNDIKMSAFQMHSYYAIFIHSFNTNCKTTMKFSTRLFLLYFSWHEPFIYWSLLYEFGDISQNCKIYLEAIINEIVRKKTSDNIK